MAPNWKPHEIAIACKAYTIATQNGIKGADQDIETFNKDILERVRDLAPVGHAPGTYHERGNRAYKYIRDNVFNDVQKFNKAIRIVDLSNPGGVSESQKVNMAIAIHLNLTKKMSYEYKDFNKGQWKLYGAWAALRVLPKFQYDPANYHVPETDEEKDALLGMLVMGSKGSVSSGSDSNQSEDVKLTLKNTLRGGRDKSKVLAEKERINKRKFEAIDANLKINKTLVDKLASIESILQKKAKLGILKTAAKAVTDPIKKEEILQKIIDLTDSI